MTLVEFLLARIVEDEAVLADAAVRWSPTPGTALTTFLGDWGDDERWIIDLPLGRALAECAAKRARLHLYDAVEMTDPTTADALRKAEACVYDDHPDYDESWRR